jgi:hypothetical protein
MSKRRADSALRPSPVGIPSKRTKLELSLSSDWNDREDHLIRVTSQEEITMWRKFWFLLHATAPSVLRSLSIETTDGNIGEAFCQEMNFIICIPLFKEQGGCKYSSIS